MEDSIVFCHCRTLFRQQLQTSSVVPKVYQLLRELFVKRDEPIRLVASGIIYLVRDAWFVAIQTHTIVARRLEAKRCVLLYACIRGCFSKIQATHCFTTDLCVYTSLSIKQRAEVRNNAIFNAQLH